MASTTLNTFILPPPPFSVRAVEMKGSWDNFSRPYQLQKDGQTGHWRGCHAFENIVCDGTTLDQSASRDGGLKMGGTYWYFYILHTIDGDLEYSNPIESSTASCPLLPGQKVNVLEVPVQINLIAGRNVSSTSIDSLVFTLDPKDKYLPPGVRRASTTTAVKERKARLNPTPKLIHRSASTPPTAHTPPETSTTSHAGQSTLDKHHPIMSVVHRLRQTRSAGSNMRSGFIWPRKLFSRAEQSVKAEDVPEVPTLPGQSSTTFAMEDNDLDLPIQRPSRPCSTEAPPTVPLTNDVEPGDIRWAQDATSDGEQQQPQPHTQDSQQNHESKSVLSDSESSSNSRYCAPLEQFMVHNSQFADTHIAAHDGRQPCKETKTPGSIGFGSHVDTTDSNPRCPQEPITLTEAAEFINAEEEDASKSDFHGSTFLYPESSTLSYASVEDCSPDFSSNTTLSNPMSPLHLSQPETPIMSEFEIDLHDTVDIRRDSHTYSQPGVQTGAGPSICIPRPPSRTAPLPPPMARPATPRSMLGGFQGYSLPSDEHTSVLTIRKLPSTNLKHCDRASPFHQQGNKQDLVHSWNDGSEHLLDDLGYLGELIN